MFGHQSRPSRRFKFGARKPVLNEQLVLDQLFLAHRLGNDLVAEEKESREQYREARKRLFPRLVEIENEILSILSEIEGHRDAIKAENQTQRKMVKNNKLAKTISTLKRKVTSLRKEEKELNKIAKNNEELNSLDGREVFQKRLYQEYGEKGLGWGTRNQVIQDRLKSKRDPRFHRYQGEGQLSFQIQKPNQLNFEKLLECKDSRARLHLTSEWKRRGDQGEESAYGILWLRIGSEGRAPVWTEIPVFIHRKLPEDGTITWVHLLRKKVATKYKWEVQFVVARDSWPTEDCGNHKCVIDGGYRRVENGLRVATYAGTDGVEDTLVISDTRLGRWKKVDDLQSIRSKRYNDILERFRSWVKENKDILPEEIQERVKTLPHWKGASQARLASVVNYWREHRFNGDESIFVHLEEWRKKDKHLYEWEDNQRKNNIDWRKNFYRKWVKGLRKRYGSIGVEDVDWAEVQKTPEPEKGKKISTSNRAIAAYGLLSQMIVDSGETHKLPAKNTSKRCFYCKKICEKLGAGISHTCEHCGETWDRDFNAVHNMLEVLREVQ